MAVVTSLQGQAKGKVGSVVYSVNAGRQIARQYQPTVLNPSTEAQVTSRSKFKLASQLSSIFAGSIAIPKNGMQSSRNLFVQTNMKLMQQDADASSVQLSSIQLTKSNIALGSLVATRGQGDVVDVHLTTTQELSRVVYVAYRRASDTEIAFQTEQVVSSPGVGRDFATTLNLSSTTSFVIFAYGVTDLNSQATAKFENATASITGNIASLISSRSVSPSDYRLTKTVGTTITAA